MSPMDDQHNFEIESRRIAKELWGVGGPRIIDGQERDGVFETDDCIHFLEATVSKTKKKAIDDLSSLLYLFKKFRYSDNKKAIKCWLITRFDPTADQRDVLYDDKKYFDIRSITSIVSFDEFQKQLIDVRQYLTSRDKYFFGSVRDPEDDSIDPKIDYIDTSYFSNNLKQVSDANFLISNLIDGKRQLITGDYGTGKSMTLRKIYHELADKYLTSRISKFPIYINLKDHIGQDDEVEVIERHARKIGFPNPHHLVRAWRAGFCILLLDGYDEIITFNIQGYWRRLNDARFRALTAIRKLIDQTPQECGVLISGRESYFDSEKEMFKSLGLKENTTHYIIQGFSTDQVNEYLKRKGIIVPLPTWVPSRPLFLGYLTARRGGTRSAVIEDILQDTNLFTDQAIGWNYLLTKIAEREAKQEAGLDGETIRNILERLATLSRKTIDGMGPISVNDLIKVFKDICGYDPDERGLQVLMRLPGLGIDIQNNEMRRFIDIDFVDAARAGDILRYIDSPYNAYQDIFVEWEHCLGQLGLEIVVNYLTDKNVQNGKLIGAINAKNEDQQYAVLNADLVLIFLEKRVILKDKLILSNISFKCLEFFEDSPFLGNLIFSNCYFNNVYITPEIDSINIPTFDNCYIVTLSGRAGKHDLPRDKFKENCIVEEFENNTGTMSEIFSTDLPLGTKVTIALIKKLFTQSGNGRKEKGLLAGLDQRSKSIVPEVLKIMKAEGFVMNYHRSDNEIWVPTRSLMNRALSIIRAPNECCDSLIDLVKEI